ncbi:hypothetical protein O3P69_011557 [Scylla paramamosain]|uniref:Uncharacterized protein n=2 Tax=Scylla paramamosain TaxID=85552 RepID=A0AAW0T6S8_SCYPA
MKLLVVAALGLASLVAARPSNDIFDFEGDNAEHEQEGVAGKSVTGEYKWESPEGLEFEVKYIADDKGYRILESNAVPVAPVAPAAPAPAPRAAVEEEAEEEEGEEEEGEEEEGEEEEGEEEEGEEEEGEEEEGEEEEGEEEEGEEAEEEEEE